MQAVKMYTTAVCPYCVRAKQILRAKGVQQIEENVACLKNTQFSSEELAQIDAITLG